MTDGWPAFRINGTKRELYPTSEWSPKGYVGVRRGLTNIAQGVYLRGPQNKAIAQ